MSNHPEQMQESDKLAQKTLEQERLIGWDFVFSIVVLLFSVFIVSNSLTMPFSGTVGGVTTTWYESPGLLPLFIGTCLFLAGLSVCWKSATENGWALFCQHFSEINPTGFLLSGGGIISYIFVFISWYDFFLGSFVFLLFYIGLYYLDDEKLSRRLIAIYYGTIIISVVLFLSGVGAYANRVVDFLTDWILIACAVLLITVMLQFATRKGQEARRKVRRVLIISCVFPAILVPTFRYFLLVPMPKEGLVVERVMNTTYYTYLAPKKQVEDGNLSDDQLQSLDDAF
ncbi:hypothetical protein [Pseudovibrio exalbescens]|nr:hypothetical protein [Pseudovibrio exalbescens]